MIDAIKKYTGIDFNEITTTEEAKKLADEKGVHYEDRQDVYKRQQGNRFTICGWYFI